VGDRRGPAASTGNVLEVLWIRDFTVNCAVVFPGQALRTGRLCLIDHFYYFYIGFFYQMANYNIVNARENSAGAMARKCS
jgi:hypothetical protein